MSRNIECQYCGAYLCSDYCDRDEANAQHLPGCMDTLMAERDALRARCARLEGALRWVMEESTDPLAIARARGAVGEGA